MESDSISRFRRSIVLGGVPALILPSLAFPDTGYPRRQISIVLPVGPGSGTDQVARLLGKAITERYKTPVIVENKPGGNGVIAALSVAKAPPDGYTWLIGTNTTQSINQFVLKTLPYSPTKDLTPVSHIYDSYMVLLVRASAGPESLQQLIKLGKRSPRSTVFGAGNLSGRIAAEMFAQMAGIDALYVPYKSNPEALTDLIGGRINFLFSDLPSALGQIHAGALRALAVTSSTRLAVLPAVPSLREAGLPGYEWALWNGVYLPAGASAELTSDVSKIVASAITDKRIASFASANAIEIKLSSPEELARFQKLDAEKTARVVRTAKISIG